MESTRKVLNFIFIVAVIIGSIWLIVMCMGGGFPVSMSTVEAHIKFDVSRMGWELLQPSNGVMSISHEKENIKEGWGCLQLDYKFNRSKPPGIYTDSFGLEGLRSLKVWMKARHPCVIAVRFKDKHNQYNFMVNRSLQDTKWHHLTFMPKDFKEGANMSERLETTRFGGYIEFRDITPKPQHADNTLWIDTIDILR